MTLISIIIIACVLSMDAFAVSVVSGAVYKHLKVKHIFRMAFFFGAFQAFMPAVGYLAGMSIKAYVANYDHWIAFILLSSIGIKMIYESFKIESAKRDFDPANVFVLLILSVATSIDALVMGITLLFLRVSIITPTLIIGATTFLLSYAGVLIGKKFGHFFESRIEAVGGLVLIGLGIKILVDPSF